MTRTPTLASDLAWLNELLRTPSLSEFRDYQEHLTDCGEHTPIVAALLVLADAISRSGTV